MHQIGLVLNVEINDEQLRFIYACKTVQNFRRELNMQEGWLSRCFTATLENWNIPS